MKTKEGKGRDGHKSWQVRPLEKMESHVGRTRSCREHADTVRYERYEGKLGGRRIPNVHYVFEAFS